jgi:hypothetical protein
VPTGGWGYVQSWADLSVLNGIKSYKKHFKKKNSAKSSMQKVLCKINRMQKKSARD